MNRKDVYRLIDGEREYQALVEADPSRCGQDIHERPHEVGEFLVMLKVYIDKAFVTWVETPDDDPDMPVEDIIRKIAGIAVHCMENHGAPPRKVRQ